MTCQQLEHAIVDYARGMATGAGTSAAIESHVERCAACAARLVRERELTRGLRAIAGERASEVASATLESRLMAAFAAQHGGSTPQANGGLRTAWLARAAAVAVLATGGAVALAVYSGHPADSVAPGHEIQGPPQAAPAPSPHGEPPPAVTVPSRTTTPTALEAPRRTTSRRAPRTPAAPVLSLDDFIALPAAAGLPDLESGRVVRVDLPLAALPSLGFEVVPGAPAAEVRADVLVGQDGQARAIRFVTDEESNRRRP